GSPQHDEYAGCRECDEVLQFARHERGHLSCERRQWVVVNWISLVPAKAGTQSRFPLSRERADSTLPAPLLHELKPVTRAGHAIRPGLIEIHDQHFVAVGVERRVELRHVGKLIRGIMHAGLGGAPEPPGFLALELRKRHRQVMAGIPLIESLPQPRFDDGGDEEIGFWENDTSALRHAAYSTFVLAARS